MTIRLTEVVARLDREGLLAEAPAVDLAVLGIADDSRRVRPGDLFCAWAGSTTDGHGFLPTAEAAGAVAALVERPVEACGLPQVVVKDGRRAAAVAASEVFGRPEAGLTLVGVTGTSGKTTTVWLLRHLLSARYATASLGTLGVILADGQPLPGSESLTTPGPVDLARTLRELVDRGVQAVAMEVSSHALDQGRVHALRFDVGVFTNLSRDHLDYHETMEAYLAAKERLVTLLKPAGTAVVNADDPHWAGVAGRASRVVRFGLEAQAAEVRATQIAYEANGARFLLATPGGAVPVELPLLGPFNVSNALAAAAACLSLGFAPEEIGARRSRCRTMRSTWSARRRTGRRCCASWGSTGTDRSSSWSRALRIRRGSICWSARYRGCSGAVCGSRCWGMAIRSTSVRWRGLPPGTRGGWRRSSASTTGWPAASTPAATSSSCLRSTSRAGWVR